MNKLEESEDPVQKNAILELCSFQFHLVVRINNTCQFMLNELMVHDLFPFALQGWMRWLKDILEE